MARRDVLISELVCPEVHGRILYSLKYQQQETNASRERPEDAGFYMEQTARHAGQNAAAQREAPLQTQTDYDSL